MNIKFLFSNLFAEKDSSGRNLTENPQNAANNKH